MTDISIAVDPFATDFERAHPHNQVTAHGEEWTELRNRPDVEFDRERFEADMDNFKWSQMILRQMSKTRLAWNGFAWAVAAYTDDMKRRERAQFQGRQTA